jgi:hypothetical protein
MREANYKAYFLEKQLAASFVLQFVLVYEKKNNKKRSKLSKNYENERMLLTGGDLCFLR